MLLFVVFFLLRRQTPKATQSRSSAASDVYKKQAKKNIRIATEKVGSLLIVVSEPGTYIVTAVAVDNYGKRSEELTVTATPLREEEVVRTRFLERADILMTSLMNLCFGKSARDCWNTRYPLATGPYWD